MNNDITHRSNGDNYYEAPMVVTNGNHFANMALVDGSLSNIEENQKSLLNSQAANRELLGVIIQDNFNLKEENSRLRERILELERSIAKINHQIVDQQNALRQEMDTKIAAVQKLATEALVEAKATAAPEIQAVSTEPGCLGRMLGFGSTQIVSVPTASGRTAREAAGQPPLSHPKPAFPPE